MSARSGSSILVEFNNVSKKFGKNSPINNVSFSIRKGEITALIGPNGAGKTTIARLMLGLETPSIGNIIIDPSLKIGYVPQKLDFALSLPITAEKFLYLLAGHNISKDRQDLFNFIDFASYNHNDISELSGGQFQKLILIATLLNNPDLIILDEPTQSLDVASQQEFYRIINQIKTNLNITIFMISHDLFTVMKNSDQVICLNGHICCSGKPNDLEHDQDFIKSLSSIGFYIHHHDHKH